MRFVKKYLWPFAPKKHVLIRIDFKNDDNIFYSHLCDLCHGSAGNYCKRNHMEDYFGHTGAFRCLGMISHKTPIITIFGHQH